MSKSVLADYIRHEAELNRMKREMQRMESNPKLQAAKDFRADVEKLMEKYGINGTDAVYIISPELVENTAGKKGGEESGRRMRRMKRYTNPLTEEVIETRGGNHKVLREWKKEHGDAEVNSWGEFVED